MPLTALPVDLPEHAVHAVARDTDGDGSDEIVVSSRTLHEDGPDGLVLTTLDFASPKALADTDRIDLGRRAMVWDGRFAVGGVGLVSLSPRGVLAPMTTALTSLGETTPTWGRLLYELDGRPVLVVWANGVYSVHETDGGWVMSSQAPATGKLKATDRAGGQGIDVTVQQPPLFIGDLDGDGHDDLLMPFANELWVNGGEKKLPLPQRIIAKEGDDERWVTAVQFEDLDGDGKLDLLVSEMAGDGSFFGSTAEVTWYRGTGSGFVSPQTLSTGTGSWDVYLRDVDGDGDLDLLIPQVDIGVTSLARGLVSKQIPVQLSLYTNNAGTFDAGRLILQTFVDLDDPTTAWTVDADLDRDGQVDLVYIEGAEVIAVRMDGTEIGRMNSRKADNILTADVDGDGVREVFLWGEGGALLLSWE
jgi:hypothetical protein